MYGAEDLVFESGEGSHIWLVSLIGRYLARVTVISPHEYAVEIGLNNPAHHVLQSRKDVTTFLLDHINFARAAQA